jgi:prepilin-type N-terminal cleavage/methylation domain-containing protein
MNRNAEIRPTRRAFTLVELLVVIAIISILAALLLPVLSKAKNQAGKATDLNNLKQIMVAVHIYASDGGDVLPAANWDDGNGDVAGWLYTPGPTDVDPKTGQLWPALRSEKMPVRVTIFIWCIGRRTNRGTWNAHNRFRVMP